MLQLIVHIGLVYAASAWATWAKGWGPVWEIVPLLVTGLLLVGHGINLLLFGSRRPPRRVRQEPYVIHRIILEEVSYAPTNRRVAALVGRDWARARGGAARD